MNIFSIVIPAFIVMMTAYLLLDKFFQNEDKKRKSELEKKNQDLLTPVRLRAYERITILLERTVPNIMVTQIIQPGMSCLDMHAKLIKNIRQEFEHNISQQIYVSDELWEAVIATRESLIKLINHCAVHIKPETTSTELAEIIIRIYAESEVNPTDVALSILKQEVRNQF